MDVTVAAVVDLVFECADVGIKERRNGRYGGCSYRLNI